MARPDAKNLLRNTTLSTLAKQIIVNSPNAEERMPRMARMSLRVLICEIREIRGQKLFPALPGIIEDQRRFGCRAFGTLGCG